MRLLTLVIILSILLTSCYSYKIFPKEYRDYTYTGEKKKAYVINPELSKEYQILKKSGIFEFTEDSLDVSAVRIKLYPLDRNIVCGQPVVASLFTLGQMPVLLPDQYKYKFDETDGGNRVEKDFELRIATRYWFWDMFWPKKNFKKKAGKTLLAEYYHE